MSIRHIHRKTASAARLVLGAHALILAPALALAHITLETPRAEAGSYYKAVLNVPHGCAGSATTRLRVRIPEGVLGVKPEPKAGWTLETVRADPAAVADTAPPSGGQVRPAVPAHEATPAHGKPQAGVREIIWSGNLPDAYFDQFTFLAYMGPSLAAGTTVYFPVVQECEHGIERWIDTPDSGQNASPAPALKLLPKH